MNPGNFRNSRLDMLARNAITRRSAKPTLFDPAAITRRSAKSTLIVFDPALQGYSGHHLEFARLIKSLAFECVRCQILL